MLSGLRELKKMGLFCCIIEGDSAVVIGWGKGEECQSWQMWNLVYEIRELSSDLGCLYSHIPREQNSEADKLANWGIGQPSMYFGYSFPY